MIRKLKKIIVELYHFDCGEKIPGKNNGMHGDCTYISGDCTDLKGDCSLLWGDCTGLRGDCTGMYGECTGLSGYFNRCEITEEDRRKGVNIEDLIFKMEEEK
jgi:hypothetical protein